MKNLIKIKSLLAVLLLSLIWFASCNQEEDLGSPDRLFRPIVKERIVGQTWFRLVWDKFEGVKSYEIDLSIDSFKTVLRTEVTDSAAITIENLDYDTQYQVRIKSIGEMLNAAGNPLESKYYIVEDVTTEDFPTFLTNISANSIIDNSIWVKWTKSDIVYTRIDVYEGRDTFVKSITLTAADNEAAGKIISGLKPETTYFFRIYEGEEYKGKKSASTTTPQVFEGNVVDLRNFSDEESYGIISQQFIDSVATLYPDGFNLVLAGGTTYATTTILVPVKMNMVTGLSLRGKAIVAMDNNFAVPGSTDVDEIRFENIFFTEGPNKPKTSSNYGGTYLFNFNQANGNLKSLVLENCDVKYKRGGIRMQTTAKIDNVTINNCLFDSIAGYGIINNGNDASYIGDILVKNSTIVNAEKVFVGGRMLGINSIKVENITVCYSPYVSTTNYFFDYNNNTVPGGITILNSLFGKPGVATVHGMRTASTNITVQNSFKTSDLLWTLNASTQMPNAPIADLEDLGKTTDEVFAAPTQSNFKVSLPLLVGKVGDPRWW